MCVEIRSRRLADTTTVLIAMSEIIAQPFAVYESIANFGIGEFRYLAVPLPIDKRSTLVLNFAMLKIISRQIGGAYTLMNVRPTINSRNAVYERK